MPLPTAALPAMAPASRLATVLALSFALLLPVLLVVATAPAAAHAEREVKFPPGTGEVPVHRSTGPYLVVCKPDTPQRIASLPEDLRAWNEQLHEECRERGFAHLQAAVDAVPHAGYRILVQPGVYHEEPSLAAPTGACVDLQDRAILEYEEHVLCPHLQNLVSILGDDPGDPDRSCTWERLCRLQVEGTGAGPGDVVVDGQFRKLNVIRADRADGFYLRNMLVQKSTFNAVYVMEQDGFVVDKVVARFNDEYGFLTFAVDHGLYVDCEGYGNGDAALYPGSASDLHGKRWSVEITRCNAHHNTAGYSGTAGNSVWVHDNDFHHNAVGIITDSVFPDHPGLPQDAARFEGNRIYSNNENFYDNLVGPDAPCARPVEERDWSGHGTVCPTPPVPVGSGLVIAGGNHNLVTENLVYDNWRQGTMLFTVPAVFRGETDPRKQLDTSHFNKHVGNRMGLDAAGQPFPNGLDFWWDEGGQGNCWQDNVSPTGVTSDPAGMLLPDCEDAPLGRPPNPVKTGFLAPCAQYDRATNHHPAGCDWFDSPAPLRGPDRVPARGPWDLRDGDPLEATSAPEGDDAGIAGRAVAFAAPALALAALAGAAVALRRR